MRGRRSVVEDYGKESIDESEISIHSSPTSGYVYFKREKLRLLKHFIRKLQGNI